MTERATIYPPMHEELEDHLHSCKNCNHPLTAVVPFDDLFKERPDQHWKWYHAKAIIIATLPVVYMTPYKEGIKPSLKCPVRFCRCKNPEPREKKVIKNE